MIRALIDTWRYDGYMPDGRSGFWNGEVQGGSNPDNVLADAYVKGLRGEINWTAGYQAMLKNAEVLPINTFSYDDESASVKEGRGAVDDWLQAGYVSSRSTRCISRTVEYSINDYTLSVIAEGEAPKDVAKYRNRSRGWQTLWNNDIVSGGFRGFLAPKTSNRTWNLTDYDVLQCGVSDCGFLGYTFQTVPWETIFALPIDMKTVIEEMRGNAKFERRLDYIVSDIFDILGQK
jgi:putative alpha-1,2-mannosidase